VSGDADVVRELYARFNKSGIDAVATFADPEIVWETSPNLPEAGTYRGIEAVRQMQEAQFEAWHGQRPRLQLEGVIEGNGRILALTRMTAAGGTSGLPIDVRIGHLYTIRDGRIVHVKVYPDRGEAVRAVGSENLNTVREMAEVWADRGIDAYVDHLARVATPDIVWREDAGWPDHAEVTGVGSIRELLADRVESTAFGIAVDELVEHGDRVLALLRWTAHGRASGAEAGLEVAILTTFSSGKVAEVDFYLDRDAARRAFTGAGPEHQPT